MSVGKWRVSIPFTALLALFCGLGALCWHGAGHNSGENLYSQRGERGILHYCFVFFLH